MKSECNSYLPIVVVLNVSLWCEVEKKKSLLAQSLFWLVEFRAATRRDATGQLRVPTLKLVERR